MVNGQTTKLTKANNISGSLRTTVPSGIIKQFDLKIGDCLDWKLAIEDNDFIVIVKPQKKEA